MSVQVSFARLTDGTWGLRFTDRHDRVQVPSAGSSVTVTKKNGSTSTAVVGEIVNSPNSNTVITRIIGKPVGGKFTPKAKPQGRPQDLPRENQHYTATSVALQEGLPKSTRTTLRIKTQEGPTLNIYFDNGAEEELFGGLFEPEEL